MRFKMDIHARSKPITLTIQKQLNRRRITRRLLTSALIIFSGAGLNLAGWLFSNVVPGAGAEGEPVNTSDLFVMNTKGEEQMFLIRGSSATWSPDSKNIAFQASASGHGLPIKPDPSAATSDSDIFVANVDDLLAGVAGPINLTNNPEAIDDDPDWSPDGRRIVFTSHPVTDDPQISNLTEIYVINVDGTGLTRLTFNAEEQRAPSWSPDGSRIVYMCRIGGGAGTAVEICTMNADGSDRRQLTNNTVFDATPTYSPDGQQIVFLRTVAPGTPGVQQTWLMNANGTGQAQLKQ
jgi:TolB protein